MEQTNEAIIKKERKAAWRYNADGTYHNKPIWVLTQLGNGTLHHITSWCIIMSEFCLSLSGSCYISLHY